MKKLSIATLLTALNVVSMVAIPLSAGEAAPVPAGTLMEVVIDTLPPDSVMVAGLVRTMLAEGESLQVDSASGPAVFFIEEGSVAVRASEGDDPQVIAGDATPEAGQEVEARAGDGVVVPPGSGATLETGGSAPARVLTLISAPDARIDTGTETAPAILVSRELTLPGPPLGVTLSVVSLEPGDSLELPDEPAMYVYGSVDRADAYLLSAQGFNRGAEPFDVYILTVTPQ